MQAENVQTDTPIPTYNLADSPIRQDLQDLLDAAEKLNPQIRHDKMDYDKLTVEDKMSLCTRNSKRFGIVKQLDGVARYHPRNCNLCSKCIEANTLSLKKRVEEIADITEISEKQGQWRMKTVSRGKEADSLKKRIKRNQDDTRFECTSPDTGKVEIWSYITNEPGKDMDLIYGKESNINSIDFDALYLRNRSTGKSFSVGSAFKKKPAAAKKDTIRLEMPHILVKDVERQEEAAIIIEETNYLEVAETAEDASLLFIFQFKFILRELEKAGIEIAAIKLKYYNMAKEDILKQWNKNVNHWMSKSASFNESNKEGNMDIFSHLIYPTDTNEIEIVLQ